MKILATICARGGSKGVKNKNIRPLAGKPLIGYTIEHFKKWGKASEIVVSTDSEDIMRVAREFGAQTPFRRPDDLASDTAGKLPAIQHALRQSEQIFQKTYDLVVDLDPTAPVRKISDLDACLELFLQKKPNSLISAVVSHKNPYFNMLEVSDNGFAHLSKTLAKPLVRRQDAPAVYSMNASIYFYSREFLLSDNPKVVNDKTVIYEMPEIAGVDIDREVDFKYVEFLLKEGLWANE